MTDKNTAEFQSGVEALRNQILRDCDEENGSRLCVESGYWPNARGYLNSVLPEPSSRDVDRKSWESGRDAAIAYIEEQARQLEIDASLPPLQQEVVDASGKAADLRILALELSHVLRQVPETFEVANATFSGHG